MNPPDDGLKAIFLAALERPAGPERSSYLVEACRGDDALRRRVEALIDAHEHAGRFLASGDDPTEATRAEQGSRPNFPPIDGPGTLVGPYKLLQLIGEGGMGSVYLADQEQPVRRKVALKIIKPGMDSGQVIARFEAERQALALMDHPNIAKVLDAGTTGSGRPFFVMELIAGLPITRFCDEGRLSPRQRLELFVPVCRAIQHAHGKGVIHRDIKPGNILVTQHDGKPTPVVIDFGIAKAINQPLTERTLFTQFGTMVGTLEYMSPEQAATSNLGVDTRTDVYSLGVLLYELLTGTTPLERSEARHAGYAEILRRIQQDDPPKPSQRLGDSSQELPTISALRNTEPARLSKLVRGELDWIVMKALEKSRSRRYETALGLAQDVERHLNDQPVEAGPPSRTYRVGKFARRHRASIAIASAFSTLLIVGTAVSIWQAVRATEAEKQARVEAKRAGEAQNLAKAEADHARGSAAEAKAVLGFLQDRVFAAARPQGVEGGLGKDVTVRAALDAAEPTIASTFRDQPLLQATVRIILGDTYRFLGEPTAAISQHEQAVQLREGKLPTDDTEVLAAQIDLSETYQVSGRSKQAIPILEQVFQARTKTLGPDAPETIDALSRLAFALGRDGQTDRAVALHEQILAVRIKTLGRDNPFTIASQRNIARAYMLSGQFARSLPYYEVTLALELARPDADPEAIFGAEQELASISHVAGQTDRAIAILERVYAARLKQQGPDGPNTTSVGANLAFIYTNHGQPDRAVILLERAVEAQARLLGPGHPDTFHTQFNLAAAYRAVGQPDRAVKILKPLLDAQQAKLGPDAPMTPAIEADLATSHTEARQPDLAIPLLRNLLLASLKRHPSGDDPAVASYQAEIALNLLRQKKPVEAEPLARAAAATYAAKEPDLWPTFQSRIILGLSLLDQNRPLEAEPELVAGYNGMKAREAALRFPDKTILREAGERIVQLYDATNRTESARELHSKLGPPPGSSPPP